MAEPHFFDSAASYRTWLQTHSAQATELLVGFYKVGSGRASMSWPESVDEALCFGWIDGLRKRIDELSYSIRFTPRTPTSVWSNVNLANYERLTALGKMTVAGEQAFARRTQARSGGYAHEQETVAELSPEELLAFQRNPIAWAFFEATPPGYKKLMIHRITTAKRTATRASRLSQLMQACASGQRLR